MKHLTILLGLVLLTGCVTTGNSKEGKAMTVRDIAERDQRPVEKLIYKKADGKDLRLLICKPDGWQKGQKRTAIVWIHGGGWLGGAPEAMNMHMKYSAARGAVGFAIQYRLMTGGGYRNNKKLSAEENAKRKAAKRKEFLDGLDMKDLVADCEDAIRYIRKNADELGVDPNKIVAIGDSAGAHLTSALGTVAAEDARVNVCIPCSSISDLTTGFGPDYIKPSPGMDGKKIEEDPARLKRGKAMSPVFNIHKNGPAFLVLAGKHDWLRDEPENFHKALKAAGVDAEFIMYPTAKHAFIVYGYSASLKEITQALLDMDAFLVKRGFLEGKSPLVMPGGNTVDKVVAEIKGPFTDEKVIENKNDFPEFLTISMKVKPPKKFRGQLFEMPGCFGAKWNVNNGGHDFTGRRMRQRGKQIKLKPEEWNDVVVSMGPEKVKIKAGDQETEIKNNIKHGFVSDKIIFNKGTKAEIKDVEVFGNAK